MSRLSTKFLRSQNRVRYKLKQNKKDSSCLRLSVFKSNKVVSVQAIDDNNHLTIASATSSCKECKSSNIKSYGMAAGDWVGKKIAEILISKDIKRVVFDRGGWKMHGCVKAVADAARKNGLVF